MTAAVAAEVRAGQRRAVLALLVMAACWGSSFPLTKVILRSLSTPDYLVLRFTSAAAVMAVVGAGAARRLSRRDSAVSLGLGALYGIAQFAQVLGLRSSPAGESGFIIGLSVVITPVIGFLVLLQPTSRRTWFGVSLAFSGLAVLSLTSVDLGTGQALSLLAALLYAVHIVCVSRLIAPAAALGSAVVQLAGCAGVSWLADAGHPILLPSSVPAWITLAYLSIVVAGLALMLQVWAQARLPANRAALAMSTEPVWAALLAVAFLHEPVSARLVVGAVLVLAGILVVETPQGRTRRRPRYGW